MWKPVRDDKVMHDSYYGYRMIFQFKQYYFQLGLEQNCEYEGCKRCENKEDKIHIHFF